MTRPAVPAAINEAKVYAAMLTIGVSVVARDPQLDHKVPTRKSTEDAPCLVKHR